MPLSIRSGTVESLARRIASARGFSITDAIRTSLELQLAHMEAAVPSLASRLSSISSRCANLQDLDDRSPLEILDYGEAGLPGGR